MLVGSGLTGGDTKTIVRAFTCHQGGLVPDRKPTAAAPKVPDLTHALEDLVTTALNVHDPDMTSTMAQEEAEAWRLRWWAGLNAWYGQDASTRLSERIQNLFGDFCRRMDAPTTTLPELRLKLNMMRRALRTLVRSVQRGE